MANAKLNEKKAPSSSDSNARPEAELESRLAYALGIAFPNVPRSDLREQRYFKVKLGHATHEIDSAANWEKHGRADILIFYKDRPLAVIEIKREDLALTQQDYEQAQSYANQLTPRPPLVVVCNGRETLLYDSGTGVPWSPTDDSAKAVGQLFANASLLAAADMRWTIEALMGREVGVWSTVVRESTNELLAEMTDVPGEVGRPFARDVLFSRLATLQATKALQSGPTFTFVDGAPVCGKSSVLRELALRTLDSPELAVLMLRGSGPGLFQALANLFAAKLEWTLDSADARQWLRRMSNGPVGPALVIAIDGVDPGTAVAADLEELANSRLGRKLRVILTTDRSEELIRTRNGRTRTALGEHSSRIEVGPLGLEEFRAAQAALKRAANIDFVDGAEYCEDYRAPWMLRAIYDVVAREHRSGDPNVVALWPASVGLRFLDYVRRSYANSTNLIRGYRLLARDALADIHANSYEVALGRSNGFVVRRDALSDESRSALDPLLSGGWVRLSRYAGTEDVVISTFPAAFVFEVADAAAEELGRQAESDAYAAGEWLGRRLDGVYLGDLIGAQAICTLAEKKGGFSSGIIEGLLSIEPHQELVENALIALSAPDGTLLHIKVEEGKFFLSDRDGNTSGEEIDVGAECSRLYADTTAWMILGQLARIPSAAVGDDSQRMDAAILLQIGKCPFPLLHVNETGLGHLDHELADQTRVLCPNLGPIEATTQAIADLLFRPWPGADAWIDEALHAKCLPLVYRVMIALQTIRASQHFSKSNWADHLLREKVAPITAAALSKFHDKPDLSPSVGT